MSERTQKSSSPSSPAAKVACAQMEVALKALAKLLVSIRFYPAGHPSLKDVTSDAKSSFAPLFKEMESVVVSVRRTGFFCEDEPVGSANTMLQKLSAGLFARRIQQLMFLKDLTCRDLWVTAQALLLDTDAIQKKGGIQQLLQDEQVTTIWANVVDVKGIFEIKNRMEEEKNASNFSAKWSDEEFLATLGEPQSPDQDFAEELTSGTTLTPPLSPEEWTFEELLRAVMAEKDEQKFASLLQRLIPILLGNLEEKSAHLVLQALTFLAQDDNDRSVGELRRTSIQETITSISIPPLLNYYGTLLCARVRFDAPMVSWNKINCALGIGLTKILLPRLFGEADQSVRKVILEALISQGKIALPLILSALQDKRWSALRHTTYLLGEIGDVSAVEPLKGLLFHRDLRVRREALRAITRIGGNDALEVLELIIQGKDKELSRQAMLCLGTIKHPGALTLLTQYVQEKDWRFTRLELKVDAVRAMGEIGSSAALPTLAALASNRCLFYRSRNDELRAAALLAIGAIGGKDAIQCLVAYENESSPAVEKAVFSALKQARRGEKNDG